MKDKKIKVNSVYGKAVKPKMSNEEKLEILEDTLKYLDPCKYCYMSEACEDEEGCIFENKED